MENVQRADLNPVEEATAYQMLMDRFALTQEDVAQRVGRSRSAVANTVRLLNLPAGVQQALIEDAISAGHARALLALPDEAAMNEAVQRILAPRPECAPNREAGQTPLREDAEAEGEPESALPDPHVQYLENRFRDTLGTRVNLNRNRDGSGRLVVHFYNDEDLEGLLHIIAAGEDDV